MSRINGVILAVVVAALTLAVGPTDSFDRWLPDTVQQVTYYVPAQQVLILVDKSRWEARVVTAVDTTERDRAIRRAACFGIYDHAGKRWEWEPPSMTVEVYALSGGVKTDLARSDVTDCMVEEATDIWPRAAPSQPAKHRHI